MTKIFGVIYTSPKHSQWSGFHDLADNAIHEIMANKPFEDLLTNFFAVEKKLHIEMINTFYTKHETASNYV